MHHFGIWFLEVIYERTSLRFERFQVGPWSIVRPVLTTLGDSWMLHNLSTTVEPLSLQFNVHVIKKSMRDDQETPWWKFHNKVTPGNMGEQWRQIRFCQKSSKKKTSQLMIQSIPYRVKLDVVMRGFQWNMLAGVDWYDWYDCWQKYEDQLWGVWGCITAAKLKDGALMQMSHAALNRLQKWLKWLFKGKEIENSSMDKSVAWFQMKSMLSLFLSWYFYLSTEGRKRQTKTSIFELE